MVGVQGMFRESGITEIPETFVLGESITEAYNMFTSTPIKTIPADFIKNAINLNNVSWMFESCKELTIPEGFSLPDSIKNCDGMFFNNNITRIPDSLKLGENVESCINMFEQCYNLEYIPEQFVIPSKVNDMTKMFNQCRAAKGSILIEGNPTIADSAFTDIGTETGEEFVIYYYPDVCTNIENIKAASDSEYSVIRYEPINS